MGGGSGRKRQQLSSARQATEGEAEAVSREGERGGQGRQDLHGGRRQRLPDHLGEQTPQGRQTSGVRGGRRGRDGGWIGQGERCRQVGSGYLEHRSQRWSGQAREQERGTEVTESLLRKPEAGLNGLPFCFLRRTVC